MKNTRWSFSRLQTFNTCPLMFKLQYIDKGNEQVENAFAQYGTLCHEILEEWANGDLMPWELADAYEERYADAIVSRFPPYPKGMANKYWLAGKEYFETFEGIEHYKVLAAEQPFSAYVDDVAFTGVIDLILEDPDDGGIVVLDHKSKSMNSMKKDWKNLCQQLYVYATFIKHQYGQFPKMLRFNMFKDQTYLDEPFNEEDFNKTLVWVKSTVDDVKACEEFEAKQSDYFCNFVCGVRNICPARNNEQ